MFVYFLSVYLENLALLELESIQIPT